MTTSKEYWKNPEKIRKRNNDAYKKNPELRKRMKLNSKKWRLTHKKRFNELMLKNYYENKEAWKERKKRYRNSKKIERRSK